MPDILVVHDRRPVALVGARRVSFLIRAEESGERDPRLRFVVYMALYAQIVARGDHRARYVDADAERFARDALVDRDELARLRAYSDERLAEHFGVPVKQVAIARAERGRGR